MSNFWQEFRRPFLVLAPMYGVTDYAFREILARVCSPDVFFTEFVPARTFGTKGEARTLRSLKFSSKQRPIVTQIWGTEPDFFARAAKRINELGFDGIDLNFGYPDREVVKKGAGVALIRNFELAGKLIEAVKKNAGQLAVSVKTRLGKNEKETEEWFSFLLNQNLDAVAVHARTARQGYDCPADWSILTELVRMRDERKSKTVVIGNGDVNSYQSAKMHARKYRVDGVMLGRAVLANPWVFNQSEGLVVDPKVRLSLLLDHARIFHRFQGGNKNFGFLKKFFKTYSSHFPGSVGLRRELMDCEGYNEVQKLVKEFLGRQG